jgi:hypothetical protein
MPQTKPAGTLATARLGTLLTGRPAKTQTAKRRTAPTELKPTR